ncbi:hypothetical protein NDU88_007448, partial [Pleurodeles waltl]
LLSMLVSGAPCSATVSLLVLSISFSTATMVPRAELMVLSSSLNPKYCSSCMRWVS